MAAHYVTGIGPTSDCAALESMLLKNAQLNPADFVIVTKVEPTAQHATSRLKFVRAGIEHDAGRTVHGAQTHMMTGDPGAGVPGVTSGGVGAALVGHAASSHLKVDLPIPSDQLANYATALDEGRCVVAYLVKAEEDAPLVEQTLRDAGLKNVKTFHGK